MKKADLHVHSKYSGNSSMFFLQKHQIQESYTEPEYIYEMAKKMGMDYVTITDHDSIEGVKKLVQNHPLDTFMGVELTVYFPEDQTQVHVLVYGFTEQQFEHLNRIRFNIYELSRYLFLENLPHSVAHATYAVNQQLRIHHIEKLILLFDNFETINGCRSSASNRIWRNTLDQLDENRMRNLALKHPIPYSIPIACKKGYTGGSDDHSGLWIGHTYTTCYSESIKTFLTALRNRNSEAHGNNGNYRYMTANFLKITHHCLQQKQPKYSHKLSGKLVDMVFRTPISPLNRIRLQTWYWFSLFHRKGFMQTILQSLLLILKHNNSMSERINALYQSATKIIDEMIAHSISSISDDFKHGRIHTILTKGMVMIEAVLAISPFMVTLREQNQQKKLLHHLQELYPNGSYPQKKRILWFTDTFMDLNGVSSTLTDIHSLSKENQLPVKFVVSEKISQENDQYKDLINLPSIHEIPLPFYEHYQLKIPSILQSMQRISEEEPSHIYISTLGPLGVLGLFMANLLHIPTTGIYHTDHSKQVKNLTEHNFVYQAMKNYEQWFYSQMDTVVVHSKAYKEELCSMGIAEHKIKWRPKGIDTKMFSFYPEEIHPSESFVLLYTGRISKDKNIHFLVDIFTRLKKSLPSIELWMAGDGPLLKELEEKHKMEPSIRWFGRVERDKLVQLYQKADLFVFPSTTDTFGMSVLEAQLCGLPAIVSTKGGPKEIIWDHQTGMVCSTEDSQSWMDAIHSYHNEKQEHPTTWKQRKIQSRNYVVKNRDWKHALPQLLELKETPDSSSGTVFYADDYYESYIKAQ